MADTQYDHVKAILTRARRAVAIHEIGNLIVNRFRVRHADTAISARIRDLRHDLEREGRTILSKEAGKGKKHHVYWIAPMAATGSVK